MKSGSTLDARTRRAEREGFEPSIRVSTYAGLANRCLQPLGHLSRVSQAILRRLSLQRCARQFVCSFCEFRQSVRESRYSLPFLFDGKLRRMGSETNLKEPR